jgi:hypothetical protein
VLRSQQLDRDASIELGIERRPHDAHATAADALEQHVAPHRGAAVQLDRIGCVAVGRERRLARLRAPERGQERAARRAPVDVTLDRDDLGGRERAVDEACDRVLARTRVRGVALVHAAIVVHRAARAAGSLEHARIGTRAHLRWV